MRSQGRVEEFVRYHVESERIGDIDPSYPLLKYVADRFELNHEQRYWVAFLYACCYCGPMAFWLYNEFPDFELVNLGRVERWWKRNREATLFQSDRRWVRSRNQLAAMVESYRHAVGGRQQKEVFEEQAERGYAAVYEWSGSVLNMGRFGRFLWLEALNVVAGLSVEPDGIPWKEATSSANGLCFTMGRDEWLRGNDYGEKPVPEGYCETLDEDFEWLLATIKQQHPETRADAWNVETSLCAFKKFKRRKRWPGYYIDRQHDEIARLEKSVPFGVDWRVLWQFRQWRWNESLLKEFGGFNSIGWADAFKEEGEPRFL